MPDEQTAEKLQAIVDRSAARRERLREVREDLRRVDDMLDKAELATARFRRSLRGH